MKITDDQAIQICKIGQGAACCIYLAMGTQGWECAKSDPSIKGHLTQRLKAGVTVAKATGKFDDCPFKLKMQGDPK